MYSSKSSIILILNILEQYSDKDHILNSTKMIELLKKEYDFEIDRKSIRNNVSCLKELNYDISDFEENGKGYFLVERKFEPSEVTMLIDAIASSKFIPTKETNELIEKLQSLQSKYSQKIVKDVGIHKSNTKTLNKDIFLNLEIIQEAIISKKKVAFKYCTYDFNKNLVPRHEEKYVRSPYSITCANENYYLICNYEKFEELSNYRIDLIKDIEILNESAKPLPLNYNLENHINKSIYMYRGKSQKIRLLCNNYILKDVIEKFGDNVSLKKQDDNQFIATIDVNITGVEFWIMQYLKYCKVLEPKELKDSIKENLENYLKEL